MINSMEVPQKVKNRTTKWSNNSTSGNISNGNEDIDSKRYQPPMFTAGLFTVAKTQKQPKSPFNGWMDKETVIYIHNGILLRHKKQGNHTICDNMDGSWRHYAQWNKEDKQKPKLYDLIYMWNLKDQNKQDTKLTGKENRSAITRGGIRERES